MKAQNGISGDSLDRLREIAKEQKGVGMGKYFIRNQLIKMGAGRAEADRVVKEVFGLSGWEGVFRAVRGLLGFIMDHNPFFLLSALLMIAGYYVINASMDVGASSFRNLVLLAGVQNLYEFLLIFLGLYLIKEGRVPRDGRTLLFLEALFLVDATLLSINIFTFYPHWGMMMHVIIFGLAVLKALLIIRAIRLRFSVAYMIYLAFELFVLFGISGLFAVLASSEVMWPLHGRLATGIQLYYYVWVFIGALLAVKGMTLGMSSEEDRRERALRNAVVLAPFASIVLHMFAQNWIYDIPVSFTDFAPLLIGLTVCLGYARPKVFSQALIVILQIIFPAAAVLFSLYPPAPLICEIGGIEALTVSPMRMIIFITAIVYLNAFRTDRKRLFPILSGIVILPGIMGYSVDSIYDNFISTLPNSGVEWGGAIIAAAFVFLGIGAILSFRKTRAERRTGE